VFDEIVAAPTQRDADAVIALINFDGWDEEIIEHICDLIDEKPE
jgi:hypothetical protein